MKRVAAVFAFGFLAVEALLPTAPLVAQRFHQQQPGRLQAGGSPSSTSGSFPAPANSDDLRWGLWPALPLAPYARRKTVMAEVVKGRVWNFDQLQGTLYVNVPVRMTVVKLGAAAKGATKGAAKGEAAEPPALFVFAPVAPTKECLRLVRELELSEGAKVKYVVLPTIAVEHKVFAGVFARQFPECKVWHTPGQYSFPLDLPMPLLGYPVGKTKVLPQDPAQAPWQAAYPGELDYANLGPFKAKGVGGFGETTFFHAPTRTLLSVDAVVKVPTEPPAILQEDPRALIYHARDDFTEEVADTPSVRRKGWQRVVLFGLFFMPEALTVVPTEQCFEDARRTPAAMKSLGWGGLYPFEWDNAAVVRSFKALQGGSGLLVAPILQTLILNRKPAKVIEWADKVASWDFRRVVPCHLESPIATTPADFRAAFSFLEERDASARKQANAFGPLAGLAAALGLGQGKGLMSRGRPRPVPVAADLTALESAEADLVKSGSLFERGEKVKTRR
mmetsp:Transcript_65285/g.147262  ORF Transcript_65285/g.147262 Transcript_65285/m.147262 type:complete len:504 (+) Transcript_65285:48-1559(+)|eukprot:CAMPEP_0172590268 /NCGR_PEP_ID=MMETSP1068-20121228/8713_1 /TAXON_ID=35684 /ORGANISM="Pseudopedinella elastica, Strain CCMP716" /LENGTH=503 /DNA_ID=CAMNT_0013386031 /DNA_START=35 /DNA_END=1546 /DNA_ORIENTATION=-